MNKQKAREREKAKILKIVRNMCLFDDDLMSRAFDNNIPATEYLLSTILNEKVIVESVVGQYKILGSNPGKRTIILDILATLKDNILVNIEVQGLSKGATPKRARFHSSRLDSRMLNTNDDFDTLPPSYVIFICKDDVFEKGSAIYKFVRKEDQNLFDLNDESFIYYVNGKYEGNDEIGKLIYDFHQIHSNNIHSEVLQKTVGHIKNDLEGEANMCDAVEKYAAERAEKSLKQGRQEGRLEGAIESNIFIVKNIMHNLNCDIEKAFDLTGIAESNREKIREIIAKES